MKRIAILSLAVVLATVTVTALAQSPLNRTTINNWVSMMKELQLWDHDAGADADMNFDMMFRQAPRGYPEFQRILNRHGFRDAQDWTEVSTRITQAYWTMQFRDEESEYRAEMQQQLDEIERSPHLTPEQRQAMRQQMEMTMTMMGQMFDAPEADVDAVRANRAALDELFMGE